MDSPLLLPLFPSSLKELPPIPLGFCTAPSLCNCSSPCAVLFSVLSEVHKLLFYSFYPQCNSSTADSLLLDPHGSVLSFQQASSYSHSTISSSLYPPSCWAPSPCWPLLAECNSSTDDCLDRPNSPSHTFATLPLPMTAGNK